MSQLKQLIQELCPNGIAYKKITDIFNMKNGYTPSKKNEAFWVSKDVPWFRMEDIRLNGRILNDAIQHVSIKAVKNKPFPANSIIISTSATIGEHALITCESLANQRFTYLMLKDEYKEQFDIKFLYYYCFKLDEYCLSCVNIGNFASVDMNKFKNFEIPVPPIEVQREIVRILDKFTESKTKLIDKLNAELVARKKQYEYYKETLLTFNNEITRYTIGNLFEFKNGINKGKEFFGKGTPIINFTDVFNKGKLTLNNINGRIEVTKNEINRFNVQRGDVFFTRTSEIKEEIGMVSVLVEDIPDCIFSGFVLRARPKTKLLLPEYCAYCFSTYQVRKEIVRYASYTTRALTSGSKLSKIKIPVPSLEEQERIVAILDRFDTLCNNLTAGIPAEIALRQKQYEYYRDKLLSF